MIAFLLILLLTISLLAVPTPCRAAASTVEHRGAVALFARFADSQSNTVPDWGDAIFDPARPGSFSHYYNEMSFGRHSVVGQAPPVMFTAPGVMAAYTAPTATTQGGYPEFARQIVELADSDIDFSIFDNDGPDGLPNSGDDDGIVDALFILVDDVPAGFILGQATGVGRLGWDQSLPTGDVGAGGKPILISPNQGMLVQAASSAEAVGSMAHEYGHVLGLPDLFNTGFLNNPDALPADDSAGIGRWGLMGWGAQGWNEQGPAPLSAWSRMQLGWADVRDVLTENQDLFIEDVGLAGVVYRVPLTPREFFLLESRSPSASIYDAGMPGEGLLIWHVARTVQSDSTATRWLVDVECADGLWLQAGAPLGTTPSPDGGDNLDFWAHDEAYRATHAGNLGDAGDLFANGMSFDRDSNPPALSRDGLAHVSVSNIRRTGSGMSASVVTSPMIIAIESLSFGDESRDGVFLSGERITLHFGLRNRGGLRGQDVRAVLRTNDPGIDILSATASFGDLAVGSTDLLPDDGFPRFRFNTDFAGKRDALLTLDLFASGRLVEQLDLPVQGISPATDIRSLVAEHEDGVQRPRVEAASVVTPILQFGEDFELQHFNASLRALTPGIVQIGPSELRLEGGRARGPRMLVPRDALPDSLRFQVSLGSIFSTWRDTLALAAVAGIDRTPPVVAGLRASKWNGDLRVAVAHGQYFEAGSVAAARARVESAADGRLITEFPLQWTGAAFEGTWGPVPAVDVSVRAVLTDDVGNEGASHPVLVAQQTGSPATSFANWRQLHLVEDAGVDAGLLGFAFSRTDSNDVIAVSQEGLWRSADAGSTWAHLRIMLPQPADNVWISPQDPRILFVEAAPGRVSVDGGQTWTDARAPARLVGVDANGNAYAGGPNGLFRSTNNGATWDQVSDVNSDYFVEHIAPGQPLYAGHLSYYTGSSEETGTLLRSRDDGLTWQSVELPVVFETLVSDSGRPNGLYAVRMHELWESGDGGDTWRITGPLPSPQPSSGSRGSASTWGLRSTDNRLYAWHGPRNVMATSTDGGHTWDAHAFDGGNRHLNAVYVNPFAPRHAFRTSHSFGAAVTPSRSKDFGLTWTDLELPRIRRPSALVALQADGRVIASAGERDARGLPVAALYTSMDGGNRWETLSRHALPFGFSGMLPSFAGWIASDLEPGHVLSYLRFMIFRPLGSPYGIGAGGRAMLSGDDGITWSEISSVFLLSGQSTLIRTHGANLIAANSNDLWIGYSKTLWKRVTPPATGSDNIRVTAVVALGQTDSILVATGDQFAGFRDSDVVPTFWRGPVAGGDWEQTGTLALASTGSKVLQLVSSPFTDRIYAVLRQKLFASDDRGKIWKQLSDVPPSSGEQRHLRFHPIHEDVLLLIAGDHLWLSDDGGSHWRSIPGPVNVSWFHDARFDPLAPGRLFAATSWGLFETRTALDPLTVIASHDPLPANFSLASGYPNPFNSTVTIDYALPAAATMDLSIHNILGQRIRRLAHGLDAPGAASAVWDGTDDRGRPAATGVYIVRLRWAGHSLVHKVTLLR